MIGVVSCVVLLMCIGKRLYLRAVPYVPYPTKKERRGQSTPLFYLELIFVECATEDVLFQRIDFQWHRPPGLVCNLSAHHVEQLIRDGLLT